MIRPDYAKYRAYQDLVQYYLRRYDPRLELINLNEFSLDITASECCSPERIVKDIEQQFGLLAKVGTGFNRLLSKINLQTGCVITINDKEYSK